MVLGWHVCGQLVVLVMCTDCGDMMFNNKRIRDLEAKLDDATTTIADACVSIDTYKQNAQDMAWLLRATFEVAWREAGGEPALWRDAWKKSRPRATAKAMGYIKDEDKFR